MEVSHGFISVCIFTIFVVPRAVNKYEARVMNHIFCKLGVVLRVLAFANAIDLCFAQSLLIVAPYG